MSVEHINESISIKGNIKITETIYDENDNVIDVVVTEHKNLVLNSMRIVLRDLVFLGVNPPSIDYQNPGLSINKAVVNLVMASGGLTANDSMYKWQHPTEPLPNGGGLSVSETDTEMQGYIFKVPLKANTEGKQYMFLENYTDPTTLVESPTVRYSFEIPKTAGNGPEGISQGYVQIGLESAYRSTGVEKYVLLTKAIVPIILKSQTSAITIDYTLLF